MSKEIERTNLETIIGELLTPISADNPVGENLKYEGTYDSIINAMRYENPDLEQGLWQRPLKKADWKSAISICVNSLKTRTKDLQIAAWLTQALLRQYGFEGLKFGLQLILLLSKSFWENIYPKDENGDIEIRLSPFVWIEEKLFIQLKFTPITKSTTEYESYTYEIWERANITARQTKDDNFNPVTGYIQLADASSEDFYLGIKESITESQKILEELKIFLHEKLGQKQPHFVHFEETLDNILTLNSIALKKIEKEKGISEEITISNEEVDINKPEEEDTKLEDLPVEISNNKIQSVEHAYKILSQVSEYLLHHEPNYPTGYIVKNALTYKNLILKEFLKEQIKNSNDLQKVYEILKIN